MNNFLLSKNSTLIIVFSLLLILCCTPKPQQKVSESVADPIPPRELIRSNFQQCSHVILLRLDSLNIKERIYADDGRLGYVIFEFFGKIQKVYKGELKAKQYLKYRLWAEYDSNWETYWQVNDELFVFLKWDKKINEFYVIEVGQFRRTSGLTKLVESIKLKEVETPINKKKSFIDQTKGDHHEQKFP